MPWMWIEERIRTIIIAGHLDIWQETVGTEGWEKGLDKEGGWNMEEMRVMDKEELKEETDNKTI